MKSNYFVSKDYSNFVKYKPYKLQSFNNYIFTYNEIIKYFAFI